MHGVLVSVQVRELLLLDDLGDRAGGASVLASATGDAGVLVSDGSDVLELQNASGAGVGFAWNTMFFTAFTLVGEPLKPHCAGSPSTSATLHWFRVR